MNKEEYIGKALELIKRTPPCMCGGKNFDVKSPIVLHIDDTMNMPTSMEVSIESGFKYKYAVQIVCTGCRRIRLYDAVDLDFIC